MSVPPTALDTLRERPVLRRATGALLAGSLVGVGLVAMAALSSTPAGASTAFPHNAIGSNRSVTAVTGGFLATGWSGDADAGTADTTVMAVQDGHTIVASTLTSVPMPTIARKHDLGPTPGYALTVPVPLTGRHTICIVAKNVGPGLAKVLDCVLTPLGRIATSTTTHSPRGAILHAWATKNSVNLAGWADDPDDLMRRSVVTMYLDGAAVATDVTSAFAAPRPYGAAARSAYSFRVPVATGSHLGCLWVSNVGLGRRTFLGCQALDTRKKQPVTGGPTLATVAKVVAQAQTHIGQNYVWGAAGPKTFDCSGLVTYSYGTFGYALPHQSQQQFALARVIPAASAVPGDLVFYHDATGSVYHVGIYTGPGMTVAAIDTAQGVDYQSIYSATWATYGSVSHT